MNKFDPNKRQTLKMMTGAAATAAFVSLPALASDTSTIASTTGPSLDCMLISRADISRAHLLMHNKTDSEITAARFDTQLIKFDNTTINMASAYVQPMVIPPQEKVMVRLNVEAGLRIETTDIPVTDMNSKTEYLPFGTRVVAVTVKTNNGVCTIDHQPALA